MTPTMRATLAFSLVALVSLSAHADERTLLVYAGGTLYDGHRGEALRGVEAIVGGDVEVVLLGDHARCWPTDARCARTLLAAHHATRLVVVQVVAGRRGCVPMRDAHGAVTGHRMLVGPELALTLVDARGRTQGHVREALDDAAQTSSTAERLTRRMLGGGTP